MKKLFLFMALMPLLAIGQDVIYTHTGDQIMCKITKVTDTVIYLEQTVGGVTIPKYMQRAAVANFCQGCMEQEHIKLPSQYLSNAANYQLASFLLTGLGAGAMVGIKGTEGKVIGGVAGIMGLVFHLCSIAQLNYAGDALGKIELNSNGVVIKF